MAKVLFLSNGAGEDSIARQIIAQVQGFECEAMPLVSTGAGYGDEVPLLGPRRALPSGGLIPQDYSRLGRDVCGGMLGLMWQKWRCLRQERSRFSAAVAVGDLYAVLWALLSGVRPVLFIGTAKSAYHHDYSALEAGALRLLGVRALVRDAKTAQSLCRRGVQAAWVGNAIMDGLKVSGCDLELKKGEAGLAMFPGSREGTYAALPGMLSAYEALYRRLSPEEVRPRALVLLAPSVDMQRLAASCSGYRLETTAAVEGVVGRLYCDNDDEHPVLLLRGVMADILQASRLAFGLAGTAHEQAAGFGMPVLACDGPESADAPLGWYRGRQKGLLGEALEVVPPRQEIIVTALEKLWRDEAERKRRGRIGLERMGPAGAARGMAAVIARLARGEALTSADMAGCEQLDKL